MRISFHGATREVTGSCHLVECGDTRILVDCGLYQGLPEDQAKNAEPFGFDPASIDFLLLTHAHLDHCGRLPMLAKAGFTGEVITTHATRELARLVMLDAAHLEQESARWMARRLARHGGDEAEAPGPLFNVLDALNGMERFGRKAKYGEPMELAPGVTATFLDAGHILGSAVILLNLTEGDRTRSVLFSGDLGSDGRPLLRDPAPPPKVDVVVMETTYGDRLHRPLADSVDELYWAISDTFARGGNVFIPTFALERAQELLYHLREGVEKSRILPSTQVYLDSPMAISATEIFRRHPDCFDRETLELLDTGRDPMRLPGLQFTRDRHDSMSINRSRGGAIILAGAGMCNGGRILHHLKHRLPRPKTTVLFAGYQAVGTRGRHLQEGADSVRIHGMDVPVKARIEVLDGLSAHADRGGIVNWMRDRPRPSTIHLVHGDPDARATMAGYVKEKLGYDTHQPDHCESVEI